MKFRIPSLCLLAGLFSCAISATAQDPHFTQYSSAPLLVNPALTGVFYGDVRFSGCYRNQWGAIQYPYVTAVASADAGVLKNVIGGDIAGVGVSSFTDNSNNGGLQVNQLAVSASYHKVLDAEGIYRLGVGFQGALTTKNLDYSKFSFGQQLTTAGFDPSLPTGEPKNGFTTSFMDYSAGMLFSAFEEERSFYAGVAMYHINRPKESYNGPVHTISPRFTVNTGGDFLVGEQNRVYWSGLFLKSELAQEITIGGAFGYSISPVQDEASLLLGAWYRYNDAISPYLGLQYGSLRGGLTYDVNVSKLKRATSMRGGFELSLNFIILKDPDRARIPKCSNRF